MLIGQVQAVLIDLLAHTPAGSLSGMRSEVNADGWNRGETLSLKGDVLHDHQGTKSTKERQVAVE